MCRVASNLTDFHGRAIVHSFRRPRQEPVSHFADAENAIANRLYNADGWLLLPSIDASGGSPTLRNRAGRPLTRAKRFLSFRNTPRVAFTMICVWKSAAC